ncbi:MAG: fumarylacetoacetate hydrolase family protein, partial [Chloroflexia bacterium]
MKLVTFSHLHRTAPDRVEGEDTHVGIYLPGDMPRVLNLEAAHAWLNKKQSKSEIRNPKSKIPTTMLELLDGGPDAMARVQELAEDVCADEEGLWESSQPLDDVSLLSPIPFPRTIRDFYAFEQHVKTARALRGLEMIPEWYDHPVFYYSNPGCVYGPYDDVDYPHGSKEVDFEHEIACVIGKPGKDIPAEEANDYIA